MKTGSIYIIKNTENDKVYIGQTTMTVRERFKAHLKPSAHKQKRSYKLYNAMAKYGSDKFYVETLESGVPLEQLDEREIEYIAQYDSFKNGYNSTPGGDGRIFNKLNNEEELLRLAKEGKRPKELAKLFGVNHATVFRTLHKLGFYYRASYTEIAELSESGLSNAEIAKLLHCSKATVTRALDRNDTRRHRKPVKLRDFDYDALVRDYDAQMPMNELVKKHGITKTTFYRIKAERGFPTRPQIYKNKIRYRDNENRKKCIDYGDCPGRAEDELRPEVR